MKVDPHSSLLAAQAMRTQTTRSAAETARAQFMAELQKSNANAAQSGQERPQAGRLQAAMARRAESTEAGRETQAAPQSAQGSTISPQREAPLRGARPDRPLPPGSLLNIVV